jgi:hypothetical protein
MTSYVRSRQQQLKSQSYQTLFGIQRNCQEQMQRLFELLERPADVAAPLREELFLRAVQSKNDCFARSVCPPAHSAALQCALDPERVAAGKCDSALDSLSECVRSFWGRVVNAKTQELMQKYERCNQGCESAVQEYQKCVAGGGSCDVAMLAAESCLGSCLSPSAAVALAQCRIAGGGKCEAEERAVLGARVAAGKDILLSMGFAESDMSPTETSEQIMGVVGVVMFTAEYRKQSNF